MQRVKDFLGKEAPPNYVAGLGRGASGFTTRADIGPARQTGVSQPGPGDDAIMIDLRQQQQELKQKQQRDREDDEADAVYAHIEAQMEKRRRGGARAAVAKRQKTDALEAAMSKADQFKDIKQELTVLSQDDWSRIPDAVDLVSLGRKSKRTRERDAERQFYAPTGDLIMASARSQLSTQKDVDDADGDVDNQVDVRSSLNRAKQDLLRVKLDQQLPGSSAVQPPVAVDEAMITASTKIGDYKRARELLNSVTASNPKHAPGWISAARLEEMDGKQSRARQLIARGCEECPHNEDVWLEAARLSQHDVAKSVLAEAIVHLPLSAKLWLRAAELEHDVSVRKRVLKKALRAVPDSLDLWKCTIELEDDEDEARALLTMAVDMVPNCVDFWLALAALETQERAQKILNAARRACPLDIRVWVAAVCLQESSGATVDNLVMIVERAKQKLPEVTRDSWLQQAQHCEDSGKLLSCQAIVNTVIPADFIIDDVKLFVNDRSHVYTARYIYQQMLKHHSEVVELWKSAILFEQEPVAMLVMLRRAVVACEQNVDIWHFACERLQQAHMLDELRALIAEAKDRIPMQEFIWLAAYKLEMDVQDYEAARAVLSEALLAVPHSGEIWLKSALLERNTGNVDKFTKLIQLGMPKCPLFGGLYLAYAQHLAKQSIFSAAKVILQNGSQSQPKSVELWLQLSRHEEQQGNTMRARAALDKGKLACRDNVELLWLESVKLERRVANNQSTAKSVLAKALQACPSSGLLYAEALEMELRPTKKARAADAIKHCGDANGVVLCAVAKWMADERLLDKSRAWFTKATTAAPTNGDIWCERYLFEQKFGDAVAFEAVKKEALSKQLCDGLVWLAMRDDLDNWQDAPSDTFVKTCEQIRQQQQK